MPNVSRLRGRFFSVLISGAVAVLLARGVVWGEAAVVGPAAASPRAGAETGPLPGAQSKTANIVSAPKGLSTPALTQIVEGLLASHSGSDKKAAALSLAQTAIGATDAVANKNIIDPNGFTDGLGKVVDGVVACLNASVWANKQA